MTTKQTIQEGERLLQEQKEIIERIDGVLYPQSDPELDPNVQRRWRIMESLRILLEINKTKIQERAETIEKRLAELNKKYLIEFEKASAECNAKMATTIATGHMYIGREPKGISGRVEEILILWRDNRPEGQEARNELYEELCGHINFLKNKTK